MKLRTRVLDMNDVMKNWAGSKQMKKHVSCTFSVQVFSLLASVFSECLVCVIRN